ncbi:alpha/beta fold hydrolase [Candidatus Poriferisocius sp.]|uniref:alpha/beta fold hydrolase n=1 Tax=Candidatus Poriferisocius sp. TaxID=3101276 RepID=UPI003B019961
MSPSLPDAEAFAAACAADGEMRLAVRHWTGGLRLGVGDHLTGFTTAEGEVAAGVPEAGRGVITITGPGEVWAPLLAAVPPRFAQISVLTAAGESGLQRGLTDPLLWWQYLPAVQRAVELLRGPNAADGTEVSESGPLPRHDSPVGRYLHIELDGFDHRVYYEEAGSGIPMLLQHTAGANSLQYRHLFEAPEITSRFRLIAYDLPYHGKSVPPVRKRWWESEYRLDGGFLRQVPRALARALDLERPAFMGCSVGGLLALELALCYPEDFRAVISLEGALHIPGNREAFLGFWHPQVGNHAKAAMMEQLCSPTSPQPYVKEVSQVYSSGWPPSFWGDLHYYLADYDIRDRAGEIDTGLTAVHIMNGEHDVSGTVEAGIEAHQAIAGSTHTAMEGVGHFPMQENPAAFIGYLLPVLDEIEALA